MATSTTLVHPDNFPSITFLGAGPKLDMDKATQATDRAGVPKWEIHLTVSLRGEGLQFQTIKVGIAAHTNPAEGLTPGSVIPMPEGLEKGEVLVKGNIVNWYRATGLAPAATVSGGRRSASAES